MNILHTERPLIMGILNVTPDSFSDGGNYLDSDDAVMHALNMIGEGADMIDVGGESTRPGSERVDAAEQLRRVLPVITALRNQLPGNVLLSVDTTRAEVAEAALAAGAGMINDISAGRDDPEIMRVMARAKCPYILMHMQGTPQTMQDQPVYRDVVAEVLEFLLARAEAAQGEGVSRDQIIIDPGIGFGKTKEHNLTLISELRRFVDSGYPVLLGASRKRFMGAICGGVTPEKLTGATCATTALGVAAGVRMFRVHDVRENRQAADLAWEILQR